MTNETKNVVYLIASPFTFRDYTRFGVDAWINRGWNVLVLDFTKLLSKNFQCHVSAERPLVEFSGLIDVNTADEAIFRVNEIQGKAVFIDLLGESFFEQKFRKLAKRKGKTLKLRLGSVPLRKRSIIETIKEAALRPKSAIRFLSRILHSSKNFEADYIVVGGIKSEKSLSSQNSKLILAHNLDYDFNSLYY